MDMIKEFIEKTLLNKSKKLNAKKINKEWFLKNNFMDMYEIINKSFSNENWSFSDKIKIILYDNHCKHCNQIVPNENRDYCSKECANQSLLRANKIKNQWSKTETKEKQRQTFLRNHGVISNFHRKDVQDKIDHNNGIEIIKAFKEKYGVSNPSQLKEVREKKMNNNFKKYGVAHHTQKDWNKNIFSQEWWDQFNHFIEVKNILSMEMGLSNIYLYARRFRPDWKFQNTISSHHQRVIDLLKKENINFIINDRKQIQPLELDIYIPEKQLAIEINGLYWHSELSGNKNKNYHLNKMKECEKQDIQLLQFWDIEIENKWNIIESMILSKCNLYKERIGARKTILKNISLTEEKDFLNKNHIQSYVKSDVCLGLYYKNELVSLMSFGPSRYNKKYECELLRFCNKQNTQVIGGASRLFDKRPVSNIISYSDNRYSQGYLYHILQMKQINNNKPSYCYLDNKYIVYNRMKFQKHKLSKLLDHFEPEKTEWENMKLNGYDRIWDCGSKTWIFEI